MSNVENRVLNINPVYQTLLPEPTSAELKILRESIITEGIRDPIIAWNNTIIDGHHRYVIANELGLKYNVVDMEFESDLHARKWIILSQIGRRNLEPGQVAVSSLELVRIETILAAERMGTKIEKGRAATVVAQQVGIGSRTLQSVMLVEKQAPELLTAIATGSLAPKRAEQIVKTADPEMRTELINAELTDDGALIHKQNEEKRRVEKQKDTEIYETRLAAAADHAATLVKHPDFVPTPKFEYVEPMEHTAPYTAASNMVPELLLGVAQFIIDKTQAPRMDVLNLMTIEINRMRNDIAKTEWTEKLNRGKK